MACTIALLPLLGREFMPELEEGNLYIRGTFPINASLEEVADKTRRARQIIRSYPEVALVASQVGRPDDGTDPTGFYNAEFSIPLRPNKEWPAVMERRRWLRWLGPQPRGKPELIAAMNRQMHRELIGVDWNFSQYIRDNVMESLSGVKGDNSVKIFGPDLDELEKLASKVKDMLGEIRGIENEGIFHIRGQSHLELRIDPQKCEKFGVQFADVNNVVQSALGAQAQTSMIEGEKRFDIAIRWPLKLRSNETSILDIPVDIQNNQVVLPQGANSPVPSATGSSQPPPSAVGTQYRTDNPIAQQAPRLRLRDLVSPVGDDGAADPNGQFQRSGASDIYHENGKRMIAIKFSVRGRDLGSTVAEARARTKDLLHAPYRAVWSGEFEEMEDAERRLMFIVPLSLGLIFVLLYVAFHSLLDTVVVLSNVIALTIGGIWALLLTETNFSISAAVGFVSLFGVAIMDGLILISSFNAHRAQGLPLHEAIVQGAGKRVRPVMMTALTAI
ncbi:MAG: efflux RND transporter permease subunit, partial [Gemmataceae bacterium]